MIFRENVQRKNNDCIDFVLRTNEEDFPFYETILVQITLHH